MSLQEKTSTGEYSFTCDNGKSPNCHGEITIVEDHGGLREASRTLREEGWQSLYNPIDGTWSHCCSACKEVKKAKAFEDFKRKVREG